MAPDTAQLTAAQITITKGNPSDEELAAVTALLMAVGNSPAEQPEPTEGKKRVARLRKRRALTPRLPWSVGRR